MYESLPHLSDMAEWVRQHPRESMFLGVAAVVAALGAQRFMKWRARQKFLETGSDLPLLVEPRRRSYTRRDLAITPRAHTNRHRVSRRRQGK
ncbi:hypothetical protein K2P56_00265 [Patescibacteria group bacterium]|nr:hypothetical protein [Patescibacteria group bacterium]